MPEYSIWTLVKYLSTQVCQVVLIFVWFTREWDGAPVRQRLVCLRRSGRASQWGSRLCRAVPGEGTGKEANTLIWGKLRKHPHRPQKKGQELFGSI